MHTTKGDYNFTWELWKVSISDTYPDMLTIYYYVYDEDGNKYTMGYDEFSNTISIGFYADEESLFFE
jgi:YD repeat-containing protein